MGLLFLQVGDPDLDASHIATIQVTKFLLDAMEPVAEQRCLEENEMSSVAVLKLPAFWPLDCEFWFVQIEAQFRRHWVASQAAKYDNVASALNLTTSFGPRHFASSSARWPVRHH